MLVVRTSKCSLPESIAAFVLCGNAAILSGKPFTEIVFGKMQSPWRDIPPGALRSII
jgi:hypothetical protein